jgi:hypothetical protein
MSLSTRERQYFDQIPDINPDQIGSVLGQGAQMLVRRYGDKSVIKAPLQHVGHSLSKRLVASVVGMPTPQAAESQYALYQQYLGKFTVPTQIVTDTKRQMFCLLQDLLDQPEPVTPAMLNTNSGVRDQFGEIMEQARAMRMDTGQFADLMGYEPWKLVQLLTLGRPYMMNVVAEQADEVTPDERALRIFDFGTYDTRELIGKVLAPFHRINAHAWGYRFDGDDGGEGREPTKPTKSPFPLPGFYTRN